MHFSGLWPRSSSSWLVVVISIAEGFMNRAVSAYRLTLKFDGGRLRSDITCEAAASAKKLLKRSNGDGEKHQGNRVPCCRPQRWRKRLPTCPLAKIFEEEEFQSSANESRQRMMKPSLSITSRRNSQESERKSPAISSLRRRAWHFLLWRGRTTFLTDRKLS